MQKIRKELRVFEWEVKVFFMFFKLVGYFLDVFFQRRFAFVLVYELYGL